MGSILDTMTGPILYRKFNEPDRVVNVAETIGNTAFSVVRGIFYFSTSLAFGPIIISYMYSRGMLNTNTMLFILKYFGMLCVLGYGGRFIGRSMDPSYRQFIATWSKARASGRPEDNEALKQYDFELHGVNADFCATRNDKLWYLETRLGEVGPLTRVVSRYAVHSFGRHMLYPGSLTLLNWMLSSNLQMARSLMVSTKGGQRNWLRSTEGDLIDTMYIKGEEGALPERRDTLVITCEGNAGFYEIGIANTPAQLGYSVLGWNHPGFGESSGLPFPANTLSAADAVMQYATSVLGYRHDQIVIFGWSIGGFPATWLAANYPGIKGLMLDATFDDVLPLAESRMPKMLSSIVQHAIREHFNLEIHLQLAKYKGPLRLIRRLQEDILTTDEGAGEEQKRASNRANHLLKYVLEHRHPDLIKGLEPQVDRWLSMSPQERTLSTGGSSDTEAGRRVAKLFAACDHYFVDFDANHVAPLDPGYFNLPTECRI